MSYRPGRQFFHAPGPTNLPERVLRAMDHVTMDFRGDAFNAVVAEAAEGLKAVYGTRHTVAVMTSSGQGAWEAAMVNTLAPGDTVLMTETGLFSDLWRQLAEKLGLVVDYLPGDWRHGADLDRVAERLHADREHRIKAVCVVHNETATGVTSRIERLRPILDDARHPALLMIDTISSAGSMPYRHDDWGIDVGVGGSQKGLMLPPGLGFNVIGPRALEIARRDDRLQRHYWDWRRMVRDDGSTHFPYTAAVHLFLGLREALRLLQEEGLDAVFARHSRLAAATRCAVEAWGLAVACLDPAEYSASVTTVLMPDGHDSEAFRARALSDFDLVLGSSLGRFSGRAFRIAHMGDLNALMLIGALGGVEMALARCGVPHRPGGVDAAMAFLAKGG